MKYLAIIFLISSLSADEDDIVERKIIDSDVYELPKDSYCKERSIPDKNIWQEDFNEPHLSSSNWNYSTSNGFYDDGEYISGWGNGEVQYYTKPRKNNLLNNSDNLFIENGLLKIQPIKKKYKGYKYTSSRINTNGLIDFDYPSEITICFKVPRGIGFWPAFWLMPSDDIKWPKGGEIDILENRGRITNISSSALHFGEKYNKKSTLVGEVLISRDSNFQDKFHSITLKWEKNKLSFFLDTNKEPYFSVDKSHPEFQKYDYPFNRKYYMILNVAVGGKYDDYWVDGDAFCTDALCSNKPDPDEHRFLIDWIEYRKL